MDDFDIFLQEQLKNPDFKKEWKKTRPYYQKVKRKIERYEQIKRKRNGRIILSLLFPKFHVASKIKSVSIGKKSSLLSRKC